MLPMDPKTQIRDFLTSRRDRVKPETVGLRPGPRRRVKGLRRDEVAMLAGISVEYYTRLERGNAGGVSREVLDAVADALRMDDSERSHLVDLVRAVRPTPTRRKPSTGTVRPGVQQVLDAIDAPAIIRNGRLDVLASNRLGRAMYTPLFDSDVTPVNFARYLFLDSTAPTFFPDWVEACDDGVALLRSEVGRDINGRELTELIGQLSTQSEEFRVRWARHDVRSRHRGVKRLNHPLVGEIEVAQESFTFPGDPSSVLAVYTPEPSSRSQEALRLLASWVAPDAHLEPSGDPT